MMNWFFNCDNFSIFNNLFNNLLNFDDFWDLNDSVNDFFNNSWNFDNFFSQRWNFDEFLNNIFNNFNNFDWNMNDLFNFLISWNFNNFFNNLFDCNNLWNFNNLFNNLFDNFLNFNNLRYDSEDFENIINTDNSHNLLINHTDNSFIDFKSDSGSGSNLFKFFKKGLDEDSEMEFNSSGLFAAVRVNVLYSNSLWNKLNDFNKSIEFIDFHNINDLLLEEFN